MNRAILIGNLTKDPTLKSTPNGVSVCTFTLAVSRNFTGQNGERETDFINVVVWRKQAENSAKYLRKGSQAAVAGRIQVRSYDAQDGSKRYVTEVVADEVQFIGSKQQTDTGASQPPTEDNQMLEINEDMPF